MRIALVSPLYPPDTEAPAPYVKELARRLSKEHAVTILTYGKHPEQLPNVRILSVSKRHLLLKRLTAFTRALIKTSKEVDVLVIENGPSVELPVVITRLLGMKNCILHNGDPRSASRSSHNVLLRILRATVERGAPRTLTDSPLPRPEILPFAPYPQEAFDAYERSWAMHLQKLDTLLKTP